MATLSDVAKRAGVSPSLVSRVLNNKTVMPVAETTVARITKAAEELGYQPNPLARALITGKTRTIGLHYYNMVFNMVDLHFARMLEATVRKARTLDYKIIVTDDPTNLLGAGYMDGVVIMGFPEDPQFAHILRSKKRAAFVFHLRDPLPNTVVWNDFEAGYMVGRYLLGLGHRELAVLVGGDSKKRWACDKVAGFLCAAQEGRAEAYLSEGQHHPDFIQNGYLAVQELLRTKPQVTALFALSDFGAIGAMHAVQAAGLSVPRDMTVVGYGDTVLVDAAYPQLTSVHTPIAEAGETALEKLVETIEKEEAQFAGVSLPVTLAERGSCAPPSR